MKTGLMLFVSSAVFSATIALVYWLVAHDPAGTMLLGFMSAALTVVALYMVFAERDADLYADKENATPAEAAGEHVGTYVTHSPAPFWIGVALTGVVLGLVVAPAAAGLGIVALCLLGALMIVRSR
ncbi:MAG: cytochrome c oxidase subunit 4 [Candidatus Eremiobacteraeota bacterium]|nr:cytochrome c oxidase subunit 4 [Candidatus Eremiobacteraeota bacterium]